MYKNKLMALTLFGAAMLMVAGGAFAGIIEPCSTVASLTIIGGGSPPAKKFVCPDFDVVLNGHPITQLDQGSFTNPGFRLSVTVKDGTGAGVPFVPGPDFWFIDCDPLNDIYLCQGSASAGADSATNANGETTIGNTVPRLGGCANGLLVVVQGFIIKDAGDNCNDQCFDIWIRTPDLFPAAGATVGNGIIDFDDYIEFSNGYPPLPPAKCQDLDLDGDVDFDDFVEFGNHYPSPALPDLHQCEVEA
jgi:hypothetical protein